MRISVTCPSCDKQGTLPEAMRGQRVTCAGMPSSIYGWLSTPAPKRPTASHAAVLDDDDDMPYDIQPLRRAAARSSSQASPSTQSPRRFWSAWESAPPAPYFWRL